MTPCIAINALEKVYPSPGRGMPPVHALKPLSLDVHPGEVFGLLGPNGAGKTTLIKLLLGVIRPSAGGGTMLGAPLGVPESRRRVGYLPENHRFPNYMTGQGVLDFFGALAGVDSATVRRRSDVLLERVGMARWRTTRIRKYSKGMLQRIGIAQALINDPAIVFLDEPTDGVDPVGRKEIRDLIAALRDEGRTIFLNSHLLGEVETMSNRVAILVEGEIQRIGTVRELTEQGRLTRVEVAPESMEAFNRALASMPHHERTDVTATVEGGAEQINAIIDHLRSQEVMIVSVTPLRLSLEDLFMTIVESRRNGGAR